MQDNARTVRHATILIAMLGTASSYASAGSMNQNLLVNPSFEDFVITAGGPVLTETDIEVDLIGWEESGGVLTLNLYGGKFWPDGTRPQGGGDWVLVGGGSEALTSITQSTSLEFASTMIDAGVAGFELSGWLGSHGAFSGGIERQDDIATLSATFFDASAGFLGEMSIIGPSDPDMPVNGNSDKTRFSMFFETFGTIPLGARSVTVTVSFARDPTAPAIFFNNASADLLDFRVVPAPSGLMLFGCLGALGAWRQRRK